MALPLVPLEPAPGVGAQVPLQVAVGEDGRATVDLLDGEASEEAVEQLLLDLVGGRAAGDRRPHEGGGEPQRRARARAEGRAG